MIKCVVTLLLATVIVGGLAALEPAFAGDPAISPDGTQVCFVYDNDLWTVPFAGGIPRRITNTPSSEWNPHWSPDGRTIAFSSNRDGVSYVYLMPAEGGPAHTVIRENMAISDWFNDSKHLLCTKYSIDWGRSFYKVPVDGTRSLLLAEVGARYATLSPDNDYIVYQQGGYTRREAYRGSANGEFWKLEIATRKYTRLTDTDLSELYPRYSMSSKALYYCASDGNHLQLMKADNLKMNKATALSKLDKFSARDISIAHANDRIVFEYFDTIYKYDPLKMGGNQISKLEIDLAADGWQDNIVRKTVKNNYNSFDASPDGLLVGFNHGYDAFFVPVKGGEVKQITFDQAGVSQMQFLDNRQLVLNKLDNGKYKMFIAKADSVITMAPVQWFGADSLNVQEFYRDDQGRWTIQYSDYFRQSKIAIADSGLVNIRAVETPWAVTTNFAVNRTGTHAIYAAMRDDSYIRELYLYNLRTNENRRILADDAWLSSLVWTPDNKSILMTRNRAIYRLDLVPRDEFELDKDNWKEILGPPKAAADSSGTKPEDKKETIIVEIGEEAEKEIPPIPPKEVEVVWEGIDKRMYQVIPSMVEYLFVMDTIDDSTFYYIEDNFLSDKNSLLKKANIYGKNIKEEFTFGKETGAYTWLKPIVYYLDGNLLKSYNTSSAARKEIKSEFEYTYDKALLNQRVFEQAWGAFGENFYDPDMHGKNWRAVYQQYRPYADKARSIIDIATIINEMIGDLNASHTGFYPRAESPSVYLPPAYIGAELDYNTRTAEGIKLSLVYPTSRLAVNFKLTAGDVLTHIDGTKLTVKTSLDSLLTGKAGKKITLKFMKDGVPLEAAITGLDYYKYRELWYIHTTGQSRKLVDELSNGRLGYIHIPSMGNSDWNRFYTELFRDNFDKEALVIDVRGNTGGHIHDQLISLLQKKRYAYSSSRGMSRTMRLEPRRAWDKPSIVLANEESFSDGEIFPMVYQELKLGKVVGTPSSGAVIGTWEYALIDGSTMRMPGTGWYKLDGTNMEGTGAKPDIIVENLPEDQIAGRDPQLERAVKELLKELKK